MLTSFFSKSNPINYLIVGALIGIGYVLINFLDSNLQFNLLIIGKHILLAALTIFIMLLLDFIIRKNNLTGKSTYGILIFTGFVLMVPATLRNGSVMVALLCSLLALRRIFSIPSEKNIEKKILDASLWIALASFFYFYSLLYLFVLYFAILRRPQTLFRYLFIPPIGLAAVFLMATAYFYLMENSFAWFDTYVSAIGFDFSAYNSFQLMIPTTLFISLAIWICLYRIFRISSIKRKERPNFVVLITILVCSLFIAFGAAVKDGSELLFLLPTLAIATTEYLEKRKEKYIKEIFLWLVVLTPVLLLFVEM